MAKYLNPKADLTFKKVFGEHENLVISLLNALLPLPKDMKITSVKYLSGENHSGNTDKKYSIVDVKCTDNYGRTFVVEMQNYWTSAFFSRALYNAVHTYSNQLKKGESFDQLREVYALSLVNESEIETAESNQDDYIHEYYLTNAHNATDVHKDISLIFVDLQKYRDLGKPMTDKGADKIADLWLKFLTEIDDETVDVDPELLANEEVAEALEIVEKSAYTDAELEAYNKYWLDISTERSAIEGARKEATVEIAKNMKTLGIDLDTIAKATGLTIDKIKLL